MKIFRIFHLKTFIFLVVKFSIYLNRLVLVMLGLYTYFFSLISLTDVIYYVIFFLSLFQFIYYILNVYFVSFVVKTCYRHNVDKILHVWEKNSISNRAFVLIPPLFEIFMCVPHVLLMK